MLLMQQLIKKSYVVALSTDKDVNPINLYGVLQKSALINFS